MSPSDVVRQRAISLADAGLTLEEAVDDLLEFCGDRRVPVVVARQQILKELEEQPSEPLLSRAAEFLDHVLRRMSP